MTYAKMSDAIKEMESLFRAAWAPRLCDYPNLGFKPPKDISITWARWRCQHFLAGQATLANVVGKRRWMRSGTLFIQVFTPLNASELSAYDTAEIVSGAYEGKASGVWFRNVRINEINPSLDGGTGNNPAWNQTNILIDFEYEQIH